MKLFRKEADELPVDEEKKRRRIPPYSFFYLLIGVLLVLISVIIKNDFGDFLFKTDIYSFLEHIGIGFLILGIISFSFDTHHWTEYFRERLKEIVISQDFLKKLEKTELIELQTKTLKAYFRNENIASEGSFFQHFQKYIQVLISYPFRENYDGTLSVKYMPDEHDKLLVEEEVFWTCRAINKKIQDKVSYLPGKEEYLSVESGSVSFSHPELDSEIILNQEQIRANKWQTENNGFVIPLVNNPKLKTLDNLDGLKVSIQTRYVVKTQKFIGWRMAHATRGINLVIRFPRELTIYYECFGMDVSNLHIINRDGLFTLQSSSWIIPDMGIVFQFMHTDSPAGRNTVAISETVASRQ